MQTFRNKFEKYKDGRESIYFSIFFGDIFLKHRNIFKKILNSVSISILLCILLFAIFFQKQIFLASFLFSITIISQIIFLIICSAIIAKLFNIKIINNIITFVLLLFSFNMSLLFINPILAQKLFLFLSIIYKFSYILLFLFALYKIFSLIIPSLKNGIIPFLKRILELDSLFKIYYSIIALTNVFYILFVFIKNKNMQYTDTLNILNNFYLLILMNVILITIAKIFETLISAKIIYDNPSLFKFYEDNFCIITDAKFEKLLKIFVEKTRNIRKILTTFSAVIGFKILFTYYMM